MQKGFPYGDTDFGPEALNFFAEGPPPNAGGGHRPTAPTAVGYSQPPSVTVNRRRLQSTAVGYSQPPSVGGPLPFQSEPPGTQSSPRARPPVARRRSRGFVCLSQGPSGRALPKGAVCPAPPSLRRCGTTPRGSVTRTWTPSRSQPHPCPIPSSLPHMPGFCIALQGKNVSAPMGRVVPTAILKPGFNFFEVACNQNMAESILGKSGSWVQFFLG